MCICSCTGSPSCPPCCPAPLPHLTTALTELETCPAPTHSGTDMYKTSSPYHM